MLTTSQAAERYMPEPNGINPGETRRLPPSTVLWLLPGQGIYREGERASSLYQVQSGAVRVYRIMRNGHRHILSFYGTGEWFGLQDGDIHDDFAEAICASQIRSVPRAGSPMPPINLLDIALSSLAIANSRQLIVARQGALERVATFVQEMSARNGGTNEFELMMSRTDVADYLGLTVESVARSFTKLRTRHIVQLFGRGQRYVHILDCNRLAALST
ncbi:nitrogen fixation transcriptional regulator FixK 1 [Rhizobium sp. CIAT894]|uniref:helix-turn-helix domain-containing protein n=1 Tax=Rhizobium sp. CIAT894 TaxID=2020312 RepID=UPI000A1E47C3|nr:helix-turn-helix domain-containing protein [Rhizobium sp. CIAT894]ARM90148.1 nitrogen fixation transcriptional regulator FixK 1 [Rhizobium sp. CIAT894]